MGGEIRFLLNDGEARVGEAGPGDTLLDFLRLERGLKGTKEGCAGGDCGACTVLLWRLHDGALVYARQRLYPLSCLLPRLPCRDGRGSFRPEGALHPVQKPMVEHHGSQCGFCTPGIVMALYGLWMTNPDPSVVDVETALQGNLCRCTGYEPIIKAALSFEAGKLIRRPQPMALDAQTEWTTS